MADRCPPDIAARLGTVSDHALALELSLRPQTIRRWRIARGIEPFDPRAPKRDAVPAERPAAKAGPLEHLSPVEAVEAQLRELQEWIDEAREARSFTAIASFSRQRAELYRELQEARKVAARPDRAPDEELIAAALRAAHAMPPALAQQIARVLEDVGRPQLHVIDVVAEEERG